MPDPNEQVPGPNPGPSQQPPGQPGYQQPPGQPGYHQPYPSYPQAPPLSPADEKLWATLTHVGGIFVSVLAPLVTYLVFKDRGPFVRHHTAEALNFQLTLLIAHILSGFLWIVLIGALGTALLTVLGLVFSVIAAVAANNGQFYRYPLTIRFVS